MSGGHSENGEVDTGKLGKEMDFRANDEAWYAVRLVLQNEVLIVKYCEFDDECDEHFRAGEFSTLEDVDSFRKRFRPLSRQVRDSECRNVKEGMVVCACADSGRDRRFKDAFVDAVRAQEHSFTNGQEECLCTFLLSWCHGTKAGTLALAKIEDICFIQSSSVLDPRLTSFLQISKEKLEICPSHSASVGKGGLLNQGSGSRCPTLERNLSCILQAEGAGKFPSKEFDIEGKVCHGRMEDADLGAAADLSINVKQGADHHFLFIENLEKDVSPSTVVSFIHEQTSISAEAYVFPSLLSELYTRGALVVDSAEKLHDLQSFINKPGQMIASSRGRPWVTSYIPKYKPFGGPSVSSESNLQRKKQCIKAETGDAFKIVRSGSEEYNKAKRLRELFSEFSNHQLRLHARMVLEEQRILEQSLPTC